VIRKRTYHGVQVVPPTLERVVCNITALSTIPHFPQYKSERSVMATRCDGEALRQLVVAITCTSQLPIE
jgi:hypothetical protein